MHTKSIAVVLLGLLLVVSAGPAAATDGSLAVAVDQDDGGDVTVTVTHNETAVEGASVDVNTTDENATYAGEGTYDTDENGTVDLPAPEENVTIDVLAEHENATATTTAELVVAEEDETVENESFGAEVSSFVRSLLEGTDEQRRIGRQIAGWVVENNPGNAPDHAGPPDDDRGPPAFIDGDDAGENATDGNATAAGAPENPSKSGERGNGPPEDRGSNGKAKGHGK